MRIRDTIFNCSAEDVLDELQRQLRMNGYPYLQKGYKRSGNSLQIQCPFHGGGQERHPSYGIRTSDGIGHCFACGAVHDLPELITICFDKHDVMANFGWQWLRKNFLSLEVEERKDVVIDYTRGDSNSNNNMDSTNYVDEEELDSYRYTHSYWRKRGIVDEDIIELFDLGYDSNTHCITFPVRDIEGHCLFVAKRSVKTKWFNYPEGVEKPLYGLYELYHQQDSYEEVIVCESMIDALTCWQYGKVAVALNGTGNDLQFKQLRKLPCRKLILATDNDEAGQRARTRIRKNVKNKLITEYQLPKGKKDVNELSLDEFRNLEETF